VSEFIAVNEHLLEVKTDQATVYAKKGSMVANSGSLRFSRSFLTGNGLQQLTLQTVTNEDMVMMSSIGTGSVFYAYNRRHVTVINEPFDLLYIESDQLLAFDHGFRVGTVFLGNNGLVQGLIRGAVTGQGFFTTTLRGKGHVCILSDGAAIALKVTHEKPVHIDPDAYLAHTGDMTTHFVTDVNWKTLIGQSSGESYQIRFNGTGTVYIQASERK
jgi:uncharacterized protein (AIM24 family)